MKSRLHIIRLALGTVLAAALVTGVVAAAPVFAASGAPSLVNIAQLQNPPALGNGINLGGFSALTHLPGDPANVFYTVTDRGPNGTVKVNGVNQTAFEIPRFTPTIVKIEVDGSALVILQQVPLKLAQGTDPITGTQFISGVSNVAGLDEAPYTAAGQPLPYDPYGLDTEGIAYNHRTNTFWLSEEYRPSLVEVSRDGTILRRLVPQGEASLFTNAPNVPIVDSLPAILAKRVQNKGLEGVAITPNGKYLYAGMQGPLANPDDSTSRVLRIIEVDLSTATTINELAYLTPDGSSYTPKVDQNKIFISDLAAIGNSTLLVDERDSKNAIKNIVEINVNHATNILDFTTFQGKTLEKMSVSDLQQAGIVPPTRTLILDLLQFGYPFQKVEGLTAVGNQVSVVNDNDFDIGGTDPTQLWTFNVPGL
jgi:hypothetical protein